MEGIVERCKHGVRWPHPCDDCHEEDMKPENLIARIQSLQADNAALRERLKKLSDAAATADHFKHQQTNAWLELRTEIKAARALLTKEQS